MKRDQIEKSRVSPGERGPIDEKPDISLEDRIEMNGLNSRLTGEEEEI